MSQPSYTVQTKINRPINEVFRAIVEPQQLCAYFSERSSGRLAEGAEIVWHWRQWGDFPIFVKRVIENERIELELDSTDWQKTKADGYKVVVRIQLESLGDEQTMLSISETGWKTDAEGLRGSHDNCSGWTHMAMCLKAYLEHEMDLRK